QFGLFSLSTTCVIDLGVRAPVVISIAPSDGNCAVGQDTIITGACFITSTGLANVTRVFAVERLASGALNPANTVNATRFVVLGPTLIDAFFEFGTVNAGKTFLIFVSGPSGTSRNLVASDPRPAGCPTGNEQGVQVTFTCSSSTTPGSDAAVINNVTLSRTASGIWEMNVTGSNFKQSMQFTINGSRVKKVKLRDLVTGSNTFTRAKLRGGFCGNLPGDLIGINPGARASQPFRVNGTCTP
ncbi:MAG: hypothetical protein AB1631_03025, partial [Acidobacteriota bacterium]